jgi:hypothetical protein
VIRWLPVTAAGVVCALLLGVLLLLLRHRRPDAESLVADAVVPPSRLTQPNSPPLSQTPRSEGPNSTTVPAAPPERASVTEPSGTALAQCETAQPPTEGPTAALPADPTAKPGKTTEPPAEVCAVDHRYGTSVDFVDDPTAAADKARKERKLLFVLHVAGNFEKEGFT